MAGVTTAARAGWGIIASSEAMNPETQGEYLNNSNAASGSFHNFKYSDYGMARSRNLFP